MNPLDLRTAIAEADRLLRLRKCAQAVELCRAILVQDRGSVTARLMLARGLMLLHRDEEARLEMHECLRQHSGCLDAYRMLGELALRHDDFAEAENCLEHALRLDPTDRSSEVLLDVVRNMTGSTPTPRARTHSRGYGQQPEATGLARVSDLLPADLRRIETPDRAVFSPTAMVANTVPAPQPVRQALPQPVRQTAPQPVRQPAPQPVRQPTPQQSIAPASDAPRPKYRQVTTPVVESPEPAAERHQTPRSDPRRVSRRSSVSEFSRVIEGIVRRERANPTGVSLRVFWSWTGLALVGAMLLWGAFTAVRQGTPENFLSNARAGLATMMQPPATPPAANLLAPSQPEFPADELADGERGLDLGADVWIHPLRGPIRRMPIRDARVFGANRPGERPFECQSGHCGVDLGETWGEPVLAAHDGVVDRVQRGLNPEHGGRYVRLSHRGGTLYTQYFHLASIPRNLAPGVHVKVGQVIGLVGDTGVKQSGAHLHFTISVSPSKNAPERYFDPEPLIAIWPLWVPGRDGVASSIDLAAKPGIPLGAHWSRKTPKRNSRHD